MSSGRAYTLAPALRDMEIAYFAFAKFPWNENNHQIFSFQLFVIEIKKVYSTDFR